MLNFGFSAFLKLLSLNERPQRTLIRSRLLPSGGGFDFHRSFRLRAHRLIVDDEPFENIIASVDEITRAPEQRSAREALQHLHDWRGDNPGRVLNYRGATFESPSRLFKVNFEPNFGLEVGGVPVAVHIWNNATPRLLPRMTYAALSLFSGLYAGDSTPPRDIGVLSLREQRLYRLSDVSDQATLATALVAELERAISEIVEELPPPPPPSPPEDRPLP